MIKYKIEIYLPEDFVEKMIDELTQIGACKIGNYDHVASYYKTGGCWRPLPGSTPYEGEVGKLCRSEEFKLEIRCEEQFVKQVVDKIIEIHPYDEVVYNIIKLENYNFEN